MAMINRSKTLAPALAPVLVDGASRALQASQALVPVASGELKASAYQTAPEIGAGGTSVRLEIGYDNDKAAYTHEGGWSDKPNRFLAVPVRKARKDLWRELAAATALHLKRSTK